MKAGGKSLKRYAVEEAHQYYREAYELLLNKTEKTREDELLLIDLILDWAMVFYYRADCIAFEKLFVAHEALAETLDDKQRLGMFFAWLGFIVYSREKYRDSYQYLHKAIKIGQTIQDDRIIGYACTWLTWTCCELGLLDEAIDNGGRAQKISKILDSDHYLFFKSLGGIGLAYNYKGEIKNILEAGKRLLDFGQRHSNIRSIFLGYQTIGLSHMMAGNFELAKEFARKAASVSVDPIYSISGKMALCFICSMHGQLMEIEEEIKEIETFSRNNGYEVWGSPARMLYGAICIAKGRMSHGLKIIETVQQEYKENGRKFMLGYSEQVLANIYLQIVKGAKSASLFTMAKNIGFLIKNVPSAAEKAEKHLHKALEIAEEIGSKGNIAMICLDLGRLHKTKNRTREAKDCISRAIKVFEEIEAETFLQQAKEALASLE